jgi:two-component sensor histidine kinase
MDPILASGESAWETPFRVRSSLRLLASMLSDQLRQDRDPALTAGLRPAIGRLIAIAHLHDRLAECTHQKVDVAEYLRAICHDPEMLAEAAPCQIGVRLAAEHALLDGPDALALGLSLIELVTSVSRRADLDGPSVISLNLGRSEGRLALVVTECDIGRDGATEGGDLALTDGVPQVEIRIECAGSAAPGRAELALATVG